jgi:hypothetical protein
MSWALYPVITCVLNSLPIIACVVVCICILWQYEKDKRMKIFDRLFRPAPVKINSVSLGDYQDHSGWCQKCADMRLSIAWDREHGYPQAAEMLTASLSRHCQLQHGAKK